MRFPATTRRRSAISGIIGAVILFTMLFTIGSEYFLFVNNANNLATQSLVNRGNSLASRLQEGLVVTTELSPAKSVGFFVVNTGGLTVNITSILLLASDGSMLECEGIGLPSTQGCTSNSGIPLTASVGARAPATGDVDTGYTYTSGTLTLEVITSNGNIFSATYPPSTVSLAAQALSSGAIGDLYLAFQSYHFYNVYSGSGCPSGSSFSGYCVTDEGQAFSIDHSLMSSGYDLAFSVSVTDLNQQQANIVLDPYTLMTLVPESGRGSLSYIPWFIVNNMSTGGFNAILSSYTPVVLTFDHPVTVLFASGFALSTKGFTGSDLQAMGNIAAGTTTPVFIVSHGCESAGATTCTSTNANYGQNSPYVSTLFY